MKLLEGYGFRNWDAGPSLPLTWSQLAHGLGVYLRGFLGLTSTLASRIFHEIVCGSYHTLSPALG